VGERPVGARLSREAEGTTTRLPAAADVLRLVVDNLPVGAWTTDRNLRLTWVTRASEADRFGLPSREMIGTRIDELPAGVADRFALSAHERALTGESVSYETDLAGQWFSCRVEPLRGPSADIEGVIAVAIDITDRKRTEDTLREVTRGYRAISELTSDVGYSLNINEREMEFEWVTEGFEALTGFPVEEANAVGMVHLVHPDDASMVREHLHRAASGERMDVEHRIITRTGDTRWVRNHCRPHPEPNGRITRLYGAIQDITERRLAQEELRRSVAELRRTDRDRLRLLTYLVRAQEDERKRIAEGIHDDSVQIMATVGLRLGMLARRVESSEDRDQVEELQELVERSVGRLRTLLFELAPPELRRAGLAAAVLELLRKVATEAERPLAFDVENKLDGEPPEETQILLYRMAQEAVTNVRKHARASRIDVAIAEEDGGVLMEVRDDGVGFSPSESLSMPGHLGLAAMRERAEMARGWWTIDSAPGSGTAVRFWLPFHGTAAGPRSR
jgi:PAS domain S-box-containing protein